MAILITVTLTDRLHAAYADRRARGWPATSTALAADVATSATYVRVWARRAGLRLDPLRRGRAIGAHDGLTAEEESIRMGLHMAGLTPTEIAAEVGATRQAVRQSLDRRI